MSAYDTWLTTDPSDDGSDEALDLIQCELARDASEVLDAAETIEPPNGLIAAALMTGTDEAWASVRGYYAEQLEQALRNRAVDVLNARIEDAQMSRAEAA